MNNTETPVDFDQVQLNDVLAFRTRYSEWGGEVTFLPRGGTVVGKTAKTVRVVRPEDGRVSVLLRSNWYDRTVRRVDAV